MTKPGKLRTIAVVFAPAVVGWAYCGALMGEGLNGPLGPEGAPLQGLKPLNPTQVLRRG
jgi:hypothetical protein